MEDPNAPQADPEIAQLSGMLRDLRSGDETSASRILPRVYDQLRDLARRRLRQEPGGHTLQATALVHEAWVRVARGGEIDFESEVHFFRLAARAMRNILVDHARRRKAEKRGGGHRETLPPDAADAPQEDPQIDLLELEDALGELELRDPEKARIIELHFFAGLSMVEVARVVGRPAHTVRREWQYARSWLQRKLRGNGA